MKRREFVGNGELTPNEFWVHEGSVLLLGKCSRRMINLIA
jgi:hypothetical protein